MKLFTVEEIHAQFDKLPADLQEAISSTKVRDSIEQIGKTYSLHVDQLGEMVDLVGLIMLGLSPSKNFVKNFSAEAGVDGKTASAIAQDINREVFDKIRQSMQQLEEGREHTATATTFGKTTVPEETTVKQDFSSLERVGGFSIEKGPGVSTDDTGEQENVSLSGNKDAILAGIENPEPHVDAIVEHLLANPAAVPEKKVVQAAPVIKPTTEPLVPDNLPTADAPLVSSPKPATPETKKPSGLDLYRELIK